MNHTYLKNSLKAESSQADKEIESIIGSGGKTRAETQGVAGEDLASPKAGALSGTSDKVKSPDFSFVDVSVRPRQTLNLLQRNLSSPTYSMSSLLDVVGHVAASPRPLFKPKKRWLKCSEEEAPTSVSPAGAATACVQPPKKRRHMFSDSDVANAMDDTSDESFRKF
jgi:hypothetical protein